MLDLFGIVKRRQRASVERFLNHPDERVRRYAEHSLAPRVSLCLSDEPEREAIAVDDADELSPEVEIEVLEWLARSE